MDLHTLGLLEFPKIREMVSGHASSSLGKELAARIQPLRDLQKIEDEIQLVNEMVEALGMGLAPPFSGLHDIRLTLRKAEIGAQLSIEQLLEISDTLTCTGNIYRYKMRLPGHCHRLQTLLAQVEDLGPVSRIITGCIDGRGHVLDMASRELAVIRQKLQEVEEKVQGVIRKLIKDPALKPILRYPNATVCGDHYVLPVAVNHRHKIAGIVHRTSSTGETLFIEPSGVASLSTERTVLKGEEEREIRKILRRLSGEVAKVARPLAHSVDILARLDFVTAKAR
ncbi:MAG: DNA strand exchange inhibitor protein, partial [Gemmataceae bacterium]